MKLFQLEREVDVSGVSGTGTVAQGVVFDDNTVAVRWIIGENPSTVLWDNIEAVINVHGHNGATQIVWIGAENDRNHSQPEV